MRGRQDFNAGTILDDSLVHAVKQLGTVKYALCGLGRIRHTLPTPFIAGEQSTCPDCADKVREQ